MGWGIREQVSGGLKNQEFCLLHITIVMTVRPVDGSVESANGSIWKRAPARDSNLGDKVVGLNRLTGD